MVRRKLQVGKEITKEVALECGVSVDGFVLKSGGIRVSYYNVPSDKGWVDCRYFMPVNYDLVSVRTALCKECSAWWAETKWSGLRLRKGDKIKQWKFNSERG